MAVIELEPVRAWPATAHPPGVAGDDLAAEDRIDGDLVRRARAGDQRAFDRLYERHHQAILQLCSYRLRNRDDAADAAQETFLRAWRALASIDDGRRFYPWLSVIARNVCTDVTRKPKRTSSLDDRWDTVPLDPAPHADARLLAAADAEAIGRALDRISERHREILQLREYDEWSYERIASDQQLELNAVKSLVWRARQALRREYLSLTAEDARFAGLLGPLFAVRRFLAKAGARLTDVGGAVGQVVGTGTTATTAAAVSAAGAVGAVTVVAVASVGGGGAGSPATAEPARPLSPPAAVAAPQVPRAAEAAVVAGPASVPVDQPAADATVPTAVAPDQEAPSTGEQPPASPPAAVWGPPPASEPAAVVATTPTPTPGTTVPSEDRSEAREPTAPASKAGATSKAPAKEGAAEAAADETGKGGAGGRRAVVESDPAGDGTSSEKFDARAARAEAKAEAKADRGSVAASDAVAASSAPAESGEAASPGNGHGNGGGNGGGNAPGNGAAGDPGAGRGKEKHR
jgi:RNA polymerase sigma-70 factor (ECF subfamily)